MKKKLRLKKITVRDLDESALQGMAGGVNTQVATCANTNCGCSDGCTNKCPTNQQTVCVGNCNVTQTPCQTFATCNDGNTCFNSCGAYTCEGCNPTLGCNC